MAAGLTFTAYYSRKFIKWGIVGVILYSIGHFSVILAYNYYKTHNQPKPPDPQAAFGVLPRLDFPDQDPNLTFNYKLETISGELPTTFPDRANVYINQVYTPNFKAYNNIQQTATRLGFSDPPIPLTDTTYRWRRNDSLTGILEMHIFQKNFDMIIDWATHERIFISQQRQTITDLVAFNQAKGVLANASLWNAEWSKGSYAALYYQYLNGQIIEVDRNSKADFIHINLKPTPLAEGIDFISADPKRPAVWALVSTNNRQVVEMHYRYYGIDRKTFTDYPLEPIANIWKQFLDNQAYITNIGQNQPGNEVIIRHFSLAYFLPTSYQTFTQPVYVIRGDNGFTAILPAVDSRLIAK